MKSSLVEGEIINIGSGIPIKIKDIIKKISGHYKFKNIIFNKIKLRKEEALRVYPNLDKVQLILKWYAKINFATGLKKTIKFYNEN
jgi:nucleoside-diphosphate-sugar epimerase